MQIQDDGSGFPWTYNHPRRFENRYPQGENNFGLGAI